jgi:hypothetical protein
MYSLVGLGAWSKMGLVSPSVSIDLMESGPFIASFILENMSMYSLTAVSFVM